jgi:hypothetical protein
MTAISRHVTKPVPTVHYACYSRKKEARWKSRYYSGYDQFSGQSEVPINGDLTLSPKMQVQCQEVMWQRDMQYLLVKGSGSSQVYNGQH